jgi:adenylylsulfate kinase-like enzyme
MWSVGFVRVAYVLKMLTKHSVTVIVAFDSPYKSFRDQVREITSEITEDYKCKMQWKRVRSGPEGVHTKAKTRRVGLMPGLHDPHDEPFVAATSLH